METLDLGWCPTCLDLVSMANGGVCHRGHPVNPDLDGPPPWVGRADPEDTGSTSRTSASPAAPGTGASRGGVGCNKSAADQGSSLLDLHLSMLQEAPVVSNNGHAAPAPTPVGADDDLDALLAMELDTSTDEPDAEDDLADLLAAELDMSEATADDDLADLLAAELDMPQPDADDDLADLLAAELDMLHPDRPDPEPTATADDDLADLLAQAVEFVETDAPASSFDPHAPTSRPDWLDESDDDLDLAPVTADEPRTETLDDVIDDVIAQFGGDQESDTPSPAPDDLVDASDLDLTPGAAAALGDDAMADLADLGLFDLDATPPPAPEPAPTSDGAAGPEGAGTDPDATPVSNIPAPKPENAVDLLNFTASGTGIRGLGRRRGRKSS